MLTDIKYYDNDKNKGMIIDWDIVYKYLNELKIIPGDCYYPKFNFNKNKWNVVLSQRSIGKTTNLLILGMCVNHLYGTVIHYIREDSDMITQSTVSDLFSIILSYKYVEKITGGRWNSITYKRMSKRFYYCNIDDDGLIVEQCEKEFMMCMSLDCNEKYKSSYNCLTGDYFLFDEFISKRYVRNDFIDLCDLFKTVARDRLTPVIILSANTIDLNSEYFDELGIRREVESCQIGDKIDVTTELGTNVHIEIYGNEIHRNKRKKFNELFLGFINPRLNSITGQESWATDNYQHIYFKKEELTYIMRNIFIKCIGDRWVRLDVCYCDKIGLVALAQKSNTPKNDDCFIYTNTELMGTNERYRFGYGDNLDRLIWNKLYKHNRFYYANNSIGSLINNYVNVSSKI